MRFSRRQCGHTHRSFRRRQSALFSGTVVSSSASWFTSVTSKPRRTDVLLHRREHVNLAEFQGEDALEKHNTSSGTSNLAGERK
jgi:hypothetical protein